MPTLPEQLQAVALAEQSGDPHQQRAAVAALRAALAAAVPTDPLLAAACLPHVPPGPTHDALVSLAAQAAPRAASVQALVVDPEGRGRVVEVVVSLSAGGRGAWTPQPAARDTLIAAQLAVAAALGAEAARWGARWQVRGDGIALRGSSIGLAVAVAARAALLQRAVPAGWAFTGGVDLDGQIAAVSGLPAKVRAAAAAGLRDVAVPAASRQPRRPPEEIRLHPLSALAPLLQTLFPVTHRRPLPRLRPRRLLLLAGPVLVWLGLVDAAEGIAQSALLRVTQETLSAENTAILPLPESVDARSLRQRYPQVLRGLADAGATAVAFDVVMLASVPEADPALAAAIGASPVPVLLAWRREADGFQPPTAALAPVGRPVTVELERDGIFGQIRRAPVQQRDRDGTPLWQLSAEAARAHLSAGPPALDGVVLRIGVTRNPTHRERLYLPPVAPSPRLRWEDPASWSEASGRVVLVGSLSDRHDRLRTPHGLRYGVEVHAAMTEALLAQRAPRLLSPEPGALAALLAGLSAAGLALLLPGRRGLAGAIVGAVVLVVAGFSTLANLLVPVVALLLAVAAGALSADPQ